MQDNSRTTILIVDDLNSARRILRRFLATLGYKNIYEASSGSSALETLRQHQVNLLISDFNLEDFSGLDLLNTVKQLRGYEQVPFILATSDDTGAELMSTHGHRFSGFLEKPYSPDLLKKVIDKALSDPS